MKRLGQAFTGEFPILEETTLPANGASAAINCKFWSGGIKAYKAPAFYWTPTKSGTIKTIYRYAGTANDPNSGYIFHWDAVVDVVPGPIKQDVDKHMYWTGEDAPRYTWLDIATTDTLYPSNSYLVGIPAPASAPTATPNADGGVDDTVDKVTRVWAVTFVSPKGEEGPPILSNQVTVWPDQTTTLTDLPNAPSGNYNMGVGAFMRIYRTATGEDGTGFYLEGDGIAIGTASYVSSLADTALGGFLETLNWDVPLTDLHSLTALANGIMAGASANTVYYSEQNLPHAWNPLNADTLNADVVGMGSFDTTLVACTEKNPYLITGISPDAMSAYELQVNQGCVSKRSVASGVYGVVYASPDGLILVGPAGEYRNITEGYFSQDEWRALNPSSMMGVIHDNAYYCFYSAVDGTQAGFILDPRYTDDGIVRIGTYATAAFSDALSDQLLLVVNNEVVVFDRGVNGSYRWRGKRFEEVVPLTFTAARVIARSYNDLTFTLFLNGKKFHSARVRSREPFRLPGGRRVFTWQVELSGTDAVTSFELGESVEDLIA